MIPLDPAVERLVAMVADDAATSFWATIAGEPSKWIGLEAAWYGLAEQVVASISETLVIMEVEHDAGAIGKTVKTALGARMMALMDRTGETAGTA